MSEAPALDFSELVREHQSMVFSIAWHYLRDRTLAEEVAQDVFLQLHKSLGSLESPGHVVFWLRKVAAHRSIDAARRRKRDPRIGLDNLPEPGQDAGPGDPLRARRLRQLVASLPEKARMVVVLRYQEELSSEEISRLLDMPVGSVKSQLARALAVLREKALRTFGEVTL